MVQLTVKIEDGRKLLGASRALKDITNVRNSNLIINPGDVQQYCDTIRNIIKGVSDYTEIKEVSMEPRDYEDYSRKYQEFLEIKKVLDNASNEDIIEGKISRIGKIKVEVRTVRRL
jgi:hypothetical protein